MVESWRPEHSLAPDELTFDEDGRICGESGKRSCPWCALDLRWEEWPEIEEREGRDSKLLCVGTGVDGNEE
eukprot:9746346-Prorocentrum_lima.AAC.1